MTLHADAIQDRLKTIQEELPKHVTLVAVSKVHPPEAIEAAYATGHRIFGENKVQEMDDKHAALPDDIEWHLIGHLQRNKVKYIVPYVSMIHAVDSQRLFNEIEKRAAGVERKIDVLLQMHIAEESSKFGFDRDELDAFLASEDFQQAGHVRVRGLMGMATFTDDEAQVRREFKGLKKLYDEFKSGIFADVDHFDTLSMGMSGDYKIAIEEGSTMVRIGSSIFGERQYS